MNNNYSAATDYNNLDTTSSTSVPISQTNAKPASQYYSFSGSTVRYRL